MKYLSLLLWMLLGTFAFADESAEELAKLAVARYGAIHSGEVNFTRKESDGKLSKPERVLFSHDSWKHFFRETVTVRHQGPSVSYARGLVIVKPTSANPAPWFAGSFWKEHQARWVKENAAAFVFVKDESVHGVETKVIEAKIDPEGKNPSDAFTIPFQHFNSGTLRLFVAPSLKGVLPRIECLDANDDALFVHEAIDFGETAPGVFTPTYINMESILRSTDQDGKTTNLAKAFDLKFTDVNKAFPAETFVIEIPAGKTVMYSRDKQAIQFKTSAAISSQALVEEADKRLTEKQAVEGK